MSPNFWLVAYIQEASDFISFYFIFMSFFNFCLCYTAHLLAHCMPFIPPVPLSSYCKGEFLLEIYKVSTYLLYVEFGSRCDPGCLVPAAAVRSGGKREERGRRERVECVWVTTPWLAALLSSSIVQLWAHTRPPSSLATPSHSPPTTASQSQLRQTRAQTRCWCNWL